MKLKIIIFLSCIFAFSSAQAVLCKDSPYRLSHLAKESNLSLNEIIKGVESRYAASGFSARFTQESTIRIMDITDTASGKILVMYPGKMRWEYEKPDRQIIITDGKELWFYRPDDNQVMIGSALFFFGDGKGAGLLSDMKLIRQNFTITLKEKKSSNYYLLKLLPKEERFDLSVVYLSISRETFCVVRIVTYNAHGDRTKIELSDIQFIQNLSCSMFRFEIPEGADIVFLD